MRFDRPITILEPVFSAQDSYGGEIHADPIRHDRMARRHQGNFGEKTIGALQSEVVEVQFTVRRPGLERIDSSWSVESEGVQYDIVGITEPPQVFGRYMYLNLNCVARK